MEQINIADIQKIASIDGNNNKISKQELNESNSKVADIIKKAFTEENSDMIFYNNERISEIKNILERQGYEIVAMMKKHEKARKNIVADSTNKLIVGDKEIYNNISNGTKKVFNNVSDGIKEVYDNISEGLEDIYDYLTGSDKLVLEKPLKLTKPYMKGENIKKLQKVLKIKNDGVFGPNTQAAVKKFQKIHKLYSDGIVGKNTLKKINN